MLQPSLQILFEDNHIIAVNKSVSDLVQPDITGDASLIEKLKLYIKDKYNKPGNVFLGVPHRLDRPVSGIVLFAKTSKALARLNQMFKEKQIEKTYWAVVNNPPPSTEGILEHYLLKNQKQNKSYAHNKELKGSKLARLRYKVIKESDRYYLLEIFLETGRHHQIRCQLSFINCPIKGDLKYGFPRSNDDGGIHLHAKKITFIHPVRKEKIEINAEPPDDPLWNFFARTQ